MLFVFETAMAMSCLPIVNEDLGVLCFVTQGARESAMIFVGVCEYDATQIGNQETGLAQSGA